MSSAEAAGKVHRLEQAREAARARVVSAPESLRIDELTEQIARGAQRGKDVSDLVVERDGLKEARDAEVRRLSAEIHDARVELRAAANAEHAATLEAMTDEELETRRHELTEQRRRLKLELRAVTKVIGKREAISRMRDIWENMSPDEREAFEAVRAAQAATED
jgi:hypothetical protein